MERARPLLRDCSLPAQVCEDPPDPAGRQPGLRVLLLHGLGAAVPDEFQRGLLHPCPGKHPGGVRSAALRLLAGTSGSGGAPGRSERPSTERGRLSDLPRPDFGVLLFFFSGRARPS